MGFREDDAWQRMKRDEILVPYFYANIADRWFLIDGNDLLSKYSQKRLGIDTILLRGGKLTSVEEKIVRWPEEKGEPYSAFFLETASRTVPVREPGWMRYCQADRFIYCFEMEDRRRLDCYWINFPELREWFTFNEEEFPLGSNNVRGQMSEGRLVDIGLVYNQVQTYRCILP